MGTRHDSEAHRFGGNWTSQKLDLLAHYLASFTTALKRTAFEKAYIDAFAGTGYRTECATDTLGEGDLLFPDLALQEPQGWLDGSARIALKTTPPFDKYLFIERDALRCEQLEALRSEFGNLSSRIETRRGDANKVIRSICNEPWGNRRAVLFLDPYGMQVEWETIESVARTQAIDTWILFPLGIGVNRLLPRSGNVPPGWKRRLDLLLGSADWYREFYGTKSVTTLFGADEETVKLASTSTIGRYFVNRLKSVFPAVADQPMVLSNSANCPLYLLCFAAGNKNGAPIALRIANHLLQRGAD